MHGPCGMRHLTRAKARAELLLERARTIAVVGRATSERAQATLGYLRQAGYDVVPVEDGALSDVPGQVDLVLVLGTPNDFPQLLEQAAEKRVYGVWFTEHVPTREVMRLARRLDLTVVAGAD